MVGLLSLLAAAAGDGGSGSTAGDYTAEIERWRRERETRLRAPDGWLSLAGLTWLHPGANRFGAAPDDEIRLPPPAPAHAGTLLVDGTSVRATLATGVSA